MKRIENEKRERQLKNVSKPKIRQTNYLLMIRKKIPSDEVFVRKFRFLPVFSIVYLIRIRIFGPREIMQNLISGHTVIGSL